MVKDHLDNEYDTIKAMCAYYEVSTSVYSSRLRYGWSQDKALTMPTVGGTTVQDHLGKVYPNLAHMCKKYGITSIRYKDRLRRGWSLTDTLTRPARDNCVVTCHNGRKWPTAKAMCEAYGVAHSSYLGRISRGFSVEQALAPVKKQRARSVSYEGVNYDSAKHMCHLLGVKYPVYSYYTSKGLSTTDAVRRASDIVTRSIQYDYTGKTYDTRQGFTESALYSWTHTMAGLRYQRPLAELEGIVEESLTEELFSFNPLLSVVALSTYYYTTYVKTYRCTVKETGEVLYLTEEQAISYPEGYTRAPF